MLSAPYTFDQLKPDIHTWPIYALHEDREQFIQDIISFVSLRFTQRSVDEKNEVIATALYKEKMRIKDDPWKADPQDDAAYLRKITKRLKEISGLDDDAQNEAYDALLEKIIYRYAEEIVGGFKIKTFNFSRKFLRIFFNRLLNAAAGRNQKRLWGTQHRLASRLRVHGSVERMRALSELGTVVVVPTHSSNMDSILIGYALDAMAGMPGFIYGAGLNLYDSEFFSYFMNRLGAYRVDRRKKNEIYLNTLKGMSTLAICRGAHSIFFPGGTRSRSGEL